MLFSPVVVVLAVMVVGGRGCLRPRQLLLTVVLL